MGSLANTWDEEAEELGDNLRVSDLKIIRVRPCSWLLLPTWDGLLNPNGGILIDETRQVSATDAISCSRWHSIVSDKSWRRWA